MSKARHHSSDSERYKEFGPEHHDDEVRPRAYNAQGSHEEKEAEAGEEGENEELHKGGRKKRKHGGKLEHEVAGHHGKKRFDRPGRKRGGAVGANSHPLSSAAKIKDAEEHRARDGNAADDREDE